jgi:hypothetical protein
VARRRHRGEGPNGLTVDRETHGHAELSGRLSVIGMRVRKNHPLNAVVGGLTNRLEV